MPSKKKLNNKAIFLTDKIRLHLKKIPLYPCTVIEAPVGYGKTTAVREYLKNSKRSIMWQKGFENSISGFWSMFSRQFREIDAVQAERLLQLGFPSDITLKEKALDLIQCALPSGGMIWVLDDYHLIDCPETAGFIEHLLWNEIPDFHIILTMRYSSFLRLEEMTLKGYVNYVRKDSLELSMEDIASYYRLCGFSLEEKEIRRLYFYTEGWISALYLLMLSYQAEGAFITPPNITTLLEKTVYSPFSEEIKDLLISICFFETITLEQAAHMWQKNDSETLLADIAGKNAFISWDARNGAYQVHKIFSEFLRGIFEQNSPEEKRRLYQRAAEWYRQTGDYVLAMEYYKLAQDFDGLLAALQLDQGHSMHNEHRETLIEYMEACPVDSKLAHPFALLVYALCLFSYNEIERFVEVCEELSRILESGKLASEAVREISAEFEVLLSFSEYNDIEKMIAHYRRAAEMTNCPARFMDTRGGWTFGSPSVLYMFHREPGKLENELELLREAIPLYHRFAKGHGHGAELVMEAERDYFRCDFSNAEIAAHKALFLASGSNQQDIVLSAEFLQVRLAFYRGDYALAVNKLKQLREDLEQGGWYNLMHTMELCDAWIQLNLGRKQDIPKWILEGDFFTSRMYFPALAIFHIVYGRALLVCGEYVKLLGSLDYFLESASIFPNLLGQIYAHIYAAAAYEKLHRRKDALDELCKAFALALPDGILAAFVENCDLVEPVLMELSLRGEYQDASNAILKQYIPYRQAMEQIRKEHYSEKRPKLTVREAEIARLVAQGFSNSEIGEQLYITHNTVKTMMKRIFEKLGINSRTMLQQYINAQE